MSVMEPPPETTTPDQPDQPRPTVGPVLAAGVATAGAGFAIGALFDGLLASLLGAVGALVGAGVIAASLRSARPDRIQWLAAPVALVLGALAALSGGPGGGADLPSLVGDALFSGGLAQPPVPFDPGWRFVLVAVTVLLGAGAGSLALSTGRTNLGVGIAVPVVALGAVAQPPDAGPTAVIGGLAGLVGGLVIAYGVEVGRQDAEAGFQPRRIVRGLAALVALGVGLGVLASAASFLLPEPSDTRVIPPQRPPAAQPQEDVELFVVESDRSLPWRLGVLDVYAEGAWMTPPFDVARFEDVGPGGDVPFADDAADEVLTVTFRVSDLAGRSLPGLADPRIVTSDAGDVQVDPRTQTLRFERLLTGDVEYEVTAPPPASTEELVAAGDPPAAVEEFLSVPPPPAEVAALLAGIGATETRFERLQAVRQVWYESVVAAGRGDPVDVPPERVAAILRGDANGEASPYEIVAGEALLARWAGVPSRMGYGWFGGDRVPDGLSVRPKHGSVWLEVYFEGPGWVPIVGRPPRAKGSLSDAPKNDDPGVRPTDELALITYVPIRRESITLLFEVVRYWLVRALPVAAGVMLLLVFGPVVRRWWRRTRWTRWADRAGPRARILASYALLRDRAWDLNVGHPAMTPLEFADAVRPDDEHRELAWLVTRAVWGDLADSVGDEEVEAVRVMSQSVARRLVGAQPGSARLVAAASRASLRQPYAPELLEAITAGRRPWRALRWRRAAAAASALVFLAGCAETVDLETPAASDVLPDPLVPTRIEDIRLQREPAAEEAYENGGPNSLVDHGTVWSVRVEDTIEASLQIAALRPGAANRFEDVRDGILEDLGGGRFDPVRVGDDSVLAVETNEQRLLLWFAPSGQWYQLLVARRSFDRADALFGAVLATQRGREVTSLDDLGRSLRLDTRRGIP